jgi:aminoglycoside phosphotransferase family enzyme/predicted kinase
MPAHPIATDRSSHACANVALLRALATPESYPGAPPVTVHETHASWVFVAGERAYKLKKPVALGFLDYSTPALRRSACREEVRVNQALAPGIYLGVRAIVAVDDRFEIVPEGTRGAMEYLVEMRSFSAQDTFAGLISAGELTRRDVIEAARLLAGFHRSAPIVADWDADVPLARWQQNVQELGRCRAPAGWRLDVAVAFGEAFVESHRAELCRRARLGLARDGHGDLRCEHVLARPTVRVVDRIEFDASLRHNDVACDLAFLAMDLEASGQAWAARELVTAYRAAGMDPGGERLRAFYAAHWALVRAKVGLIAAAAHDGGARDAHSAQAQRLWSLADQLCWRARGPLAVIVCGPAASGKSVLARELSRRSRMPVVSSDEARKRLAHLDSRQPARPEHYSARFTHLTYQQLTHEALLAHRRGDGVIVDATCHTRSARAVLLERLRRAGVAPLIVRCEAPLELLRERAAARLSDPQRVSDATPAIAEAQFEAFEEFDPRSDGEVLRLDTSGDLDGQLAEIAHAVDRRRLQRTRPGPC